MAAQSADGGCCSRLTATAVTLFSHWVSRSGIVGVQLSRVGLLQAAALLHALSSLLPLCCLCCCGLCSLQGLCRGRRSASKRDLMDLILILHILRPGLLPWASQQRREKRVSCSCTALWDSPPCTAVWQLEQCASWNLNNCNGFAVACCPAVLYRNPMQETARFLQTYHRGHAKVYNLCSEHSYSAQHLSVVLQQYPYDDHQVHSIRALRTNWSLQLCP